MPQIDAYIREHLTENISLTQLATHVGYNKTYLSGQFRQWFGFRLSDYVKQMRLQKAIPLLEEQKKTILEIALAFWETAVMLPCQKSILEIISLECLP